MVVGGAGAVWGLGLARFLAEAARWPFFYTSPLAVAVLAIVGAAVALGLWRWSAWERRSGSEAAWSSFVPLVLPLLYVAGAASRPLAGGTLLVGGAGLTLLLAWRERPSWILPALLGLVALFVYLRTLLPSVGEADTFEFQVVVPQLGVAHPTGYPLYVLLGRLFTLLPFGNVAWRLNLASAVFGAAAVVALYGIIRRLTGPAGERRRVWKAALRGAEVCRSAFHSRRVLLELIPFLAAMAFALSPAFWSQAVAAEVYTLHNLLAAAILWLLLRQIDPSAGRDAGWVRRWYGVSFLLGLSLTNHLTTALLLPAALVALLTSFRFRPLGFLRSLRGPGHAVGIVKTQHDGGPLENSKGLGQVFDVREGLIAAALFLLGLSVYLFIPLRWPALHDGARMTPGAFLRYITGSQFHGALRLDGWRDPTRWQIVGRLMQQPFGWAGLGLAVVGVARLAARRWRALALTGATFLAFFVYGLLYYVADVAVFLLPAHLILAIWMGVGGTALARLLPGVGDEGPEGDDSLALGLWRPALVAFLALLPLSQLWTHLPAVDRSDDRGRYAWGRYALRQPLDEGSAVLADPKRFAPLYYLQQVEGVRPDLDMVLLGSEELYQEELRRRLAEGQTVYLARYLPHLGDLYLRSVGPLVEVRQLADARTAVGEGLARFDEVIQLSDADVEADPLGRALHHVTLHWRAASAVEEDLVVRLRLVDADGDAAWTSEGVRPVGGLYPTNAWPPGVPVSDYHELPIPPWLPPGAYQLQAGLFAPFGDEGLAADGTSTPWVSLGVVEVELPSQPQPLPRGRLLHLGGEAWLTGVDAPQEGGAGAPLTVDLAWRGVAEGERVQLAWGDGGAHASSLVAGMMRSRHTITAPEEVGLHTLYVWLAGEPARCGWLATPAQGCPLADVRVIAGGEGLATFGDRVLLLEAQVGRDEARPGDVVPVTLRWRGLRSMDVDYTVFVHLVGPDGRLHGQVDSWPVQGSFPTSQWAPGEAVLDRYEVRLEPDAPAGAYRVEVGLYELETMERLPVLNAAGEAIGDSFVVGAFDLPES